MEIWKAIPSFPDFEASSLGRIRRVANCKNSRDTGGIIKARVQNAGYLMVCLNYENKVHARLVHRLVAEAFLGPCPKGFNVDHKDFSKLNNAAENLTYVKVAVNCAKFKDGHLTGERNAAAKITNQQAAEIRELHAQGLGYKKISKLLNISWSIVRNAASGKTYTPA